MVICGYMLASFPGLAQLSVASSMEKRERPGIIYHVSDVGVKRRVERTLLSVGSPN